MAIKRETAIKCRIKDLLEGRYVKREGWEPNYLETNKGRISRANILGVIISNEDELLMMDDGSGQIQLRNFDAEKDFKQKIGDLVLVIGRPRIFNEQKYLVPEIIKKVDDPKWIEHRKLELKQQSIQTIKEESKQEIPKSEDKKIETTAKKESSSETTLIEQILKKVEELDDGMGTRIDDVLSFINDESTNIIINKLIEEGEIFEIKPGIVKLI